jgi:Uncharacterised protein family (UPF0153).
MPATLPDLSSFFQRYEALAAKTDALFEQVRATYPAEVCCHKGCTSCCHALFDLSLVEALYLKYRFDQRFPAGIERAAIVDKADSADRKAVKMKRDFYREARAGTDSEEILQKAAEATLRCPLLGENDECVLYEFRPLTCRVYGIPSAIGGKGHTCGKTGFSKGTLYPTVNMDILQQSLASLSHELAAHIGTRYDELHLVYIPVSFAIVTDFTPEYLGISKEPARKDT